MPSNGTAAKMSNPIGRALDAALRPTHPPRRANQLREFARLSALRGPFGAQNGVRRKTDFVSRFNSIAWSRSGRRKFALYEKQKSCIFSHRPASTRGALRDRHECWMRDAMDVSAQARLGAWTNGLEADGQAVWSRHPDAGVNPRVTSPGGWWLKSPVHQGEHGAAVNTIARGMPGCLG